MVFLTIVIFLAFVIVVASGILQMIGVIGEEIFKIRKEACSEQINGKAIVKSVIWIIVAIGMIVIILYITFGKVFVK